MKAESKASAAVLREMKVMEFEERRNDKRMMYWVEFAAKFGFTHLHSTAYKMDIIQQNDFDIVAIIGVLGIAFIYSISHILKRLVKAK